MQKRFSVVNLHGTTSGDLAVPVIGDNGNWWIGNDNLSESLENHENQNHDYRNVLLNT